MKGQHVWIVVLQLIMYSFSPVIFASKPAALKPQQQQVLNTSKSFPAIIRQPIQQQNQKKDNSPTNKEALTDISITTNHENDVNSNANNWLSNLKNENSGLIPWNRYIPGQSITNFLENYPSLPPFLHTPKLMPFFGFASPILIPYPLIMTPDMLYSQSYEQNLPNEDNMSRTANIRPPTSNENFQRNSPIYYVRLPPTPYMFLPSLSYPPPAPSTYGPILHYPTIPTLQALPLSTIFNPPLNFLANGKPNGIFRIDSTSQDIQNQLQSTNSRPFAGSYRPMLQQHGANPYTFTSSFSPQQESKLTSLKRPFVFNGRPDDIYILPNSYNPLYTEAEYY